MSDVNPNDVTAPLGDPGAPIFIPISLTANVAEITVGTTVDFAFVVDQSSLPSNPAYSVAFYSTRSQPTLSANAPVVKHSHDLPLTHLLVSPLPTIVITEDGGEFSFTFDIDSVPDAPSMVIVTIVIDNIDDNDSLGLCSLSYS